MKIPSIIAAFVKAQNDRDSSAVVACFADEVVVHDEGLERPGLVAIKEWSDKGFQKFQYSIDPKNLAEENDKTVLTATVTATSQEVRSRWTSSSSSMGTRSSP